MTGQDILLTALPLSLTALTFQSHDHYDHLDRDVVRALAIDPAQSRARFVVPLGVGAHLERWGVPAARITELDWQESVTVGPLGDIAGVGCLVDSCRECINCRAEHGITSDIEIVDIASINEAHEQMLKSDVRYRFVIDMASLA